MGSVRVVVIVRHLRLLHVIEDLLRDVPGIRIVGRFAEARGLARQVARLAPDVVVASIRTLGREHAMVSTEIARVSPGSKLVLIHPVPVFPCEARGSRVHLPEDGLVRLLRPAVERLAGGSGEQAVTDQTLGVVSC